MWSSEWRSSSNEAEPVGDVVDGARRVEPVEEALVAYNGSDDSTDGSRKTTVPGRDPREVGMGQAIAAGVAATRAEMLVFLDADLRRCVATTCDDSRAK